MRWFVQLLRDDRGATIVEYAVISAMLSVAMIAALVAIASECVKRLSVTSANMTSLGTSPP